MRSAYFEAFGGPENVRIGERPDPAPDAEHVLVRTHAAGVGIWDLGILAGRVGQVPLPHIPGAEVAGTVEVAGGGFRAGDRVFCSLWPSLGGGFAELAAAHVDRIAAIPDGLDFPEAAGLVISAGTAHEGLVDRGRVQAGETVLVTAASGGVGSAAIQIARSLGARVFAIASARNHEYVLSLGAEMAVDYHDPDFVERLRLAVPTGFDVLFDGTGNEVRDRAVELVRDGGRGIFILGAPAPRDRVEFQAFFATVVASRLQAVAILAAQGKLRMRIDAELPLEQAREAMERVARRHTVGRVVLRLDR